MASPRAGEPAVTSRLAINPGSAERLLTGVATSLCQTNINELLTEIWLQELIDRGVHYAWYHTYRPVGPKMSMELALRPEQLVDYGPLHEALSKG